MATSILLVEDSPVLRKALRSTLLGLGGVEVAAELSTEAQARSWLQVHPAGWDLAIVDLILEQGTGMGVLDQCRRRDARQKVVVFSDYTTDGVRAHCLRMGADAVFQKGTQGQALFDYCTAFCRPRNC